MKLDRQLQKDILTKLKSVYPKCPADISLPSDVFDAPEVTANLAYLYEHGLISSIFGENDLMMAGHNFRYSKITAIGLDFLEQDGGLSAILGTVTVKLHADTIRDLLEKKIMSSSLPATEKKSVVDTLKELPGEALKTLTSKLVEKGLEALPTPQAIVTLIQTLM